MDNIKIEEIVVAIASCKWAYGRATDENLQPVFDQSGFTKYVEKCLEAFEVGKDILKRKGQK